mgnify:CR=1 FL=1
MEKPRPYAVGVLIALTLCSSFRSLIILHPAKQFGQNDGLIPLIVFR